MVKWKLRYAGTRSYCNQELETTNRILNCKHNNSSRMDRRTTFKTGQVKNPTLGVWGIFELRTPFKS